ncbi:MAG: MetQ/NlpA family ABC transporter substrate-binding protein [Alistipes sp.]|nr:MetQ/NlpA family ABC transporter substrate-binding protein [Alistipes sp.]
MKNLKRAAVLFLTVALAALTACGGDKQVSGNAGDKKELKYGKAAGPYTVLFEDAIKPILETQGYTVTAVDFSDLLQNDIALNEGEIDFNVEQHTAYANNFNEAQKGNLVPVSPIPTVPAAIFSATNTSLDGIKDKAKVAVPDDAANTARAYVLLQKAGWIKLDPNVDLSLVKQSDIIENPYNIQFTEMTSTNIPAVLDDFDYAVITGSIVYNAGMDASTALLQEDILEHLILQVVVKEENKDAQWVKDIVAAYHSDEFKKYLDENNNGLWYVPEELFN